MGKRGPKPMPSGLKLLHDERHLNRVNAYEPKPRPAEPMPPEDASPAVLEVWNGVVAELTDMGIAYRSDEPAIRCYCEAIVTHRRASAVLADGEILVAGLRGSQVKNPALQVQRDSAQLIRAFAQEFGLTPSARTGVQTRVADDVNDPFSSAYGKGNPF